MARFFASLLAALRRGLGLAFAPFAWLADVLSARPDPAEDDAAEARQARREAMARAAQARREADERKATAREPGASAPWTAAHGVAIRAAARAILRADPPPQGIDPRLASYLRARCDSELHAVASLPSPDLRRLVAGELVPPLPRFRPDEWTGEAIARRLMSEPPSPVLAAYLARAKAGAAPAPGADSPAPRMAMAVPAR